MTDAAHDGAELAILINRLRGHRAQDGEHAAIAPAAPACSTSRATSPAASSPPTANCSRPPTACRSTCWSGRTCMARAMKAFHPDAAGAAMPSCTTRPTTATRTPPTTPSSCPVIDDDGVHRFTVLAKAHQADCGNALPTTYMGDRARRLRRRRADLSRRQGAAGLSATSTTSSACARCAFACRASGGATTSPCSAPRASASASCSRSAREVGWDTLDAFAGAMVRLQRAAHGRRAFAQMPAGRRIARPARTIRSRERRADGVRDRRHRRVAARQDGRIDVDLRDNIGCTAVRPQPHRSDVRARRRCSACSTAIGSDVPRNAGSFRRIAVHLRENCVAGIPETSDQLLGRDHQPRRPRRQRGLAGDRRARRRLRHGRMRRRACRLGRRSSPASIRAPASASSTKLFLGSHGGARRRRPPIAGSPTCMSATAAMCFIDSVELDELHQPIWVAERRLCRTPKAPGRTSRRARACSSSSARSAARSSVAYVSDGSINAALGARGGGVGGPAGHLKRRTDGALEPLANCVKVTLTDGETIQSICCGGGGYGPPVERDPSRVLADVAEGWISRQRARDVYGVAIDEAMRVDEAATQRLRAQATAASSPSLENQ